MKITFKSYRYPFQKGDFAIAPFAGQFELSWRPFSGNPMVLSRHLTPASAADKLQSHEAFLVQKGIVFEIPKECGDIGNWQKADYGPLGG